MLLFGMLLIAGCTVEDLLCAVDDAADSDGRRWQAQSSPGAISEATATPTRDLEPAKVVQLADATFALAGTASVEGTTVSAAAIWIRDGHRVYRYVGIARAIDPLEPTLAIARQSID